MSRRLATVQNEVLDKLSSEELRKLVFDKGEASQAWFAKTFSAKDYQPRDV